MCKVQNHVARQCGTSRKQVGRDGRSEAEGVISGVKVEDEWEAEMGAEAEGGARGVPLTITPPPDEHQLNAEERAIEQKEIEPEVRAQMQCRASGFLVWNSVTFSRAWLRFSEYSQVFPSVP